MLNDIRTLRNPATEFDGPLAPLGKLLSNYAWTWRPDALEVVRAIDLERVGRGESPIRLLQNPDVRARLQKDKSFLAKLANAVKSMDAYLAITPEPPKGIDPNHPVAYYCAEYGLHESFAQYCGGLGILAGDHVREASDMGLPFVGIGIFYRLGFFRQDLEPNGRQQHVYPRFDPMDHPLERVLDPKSGKPLTVSIDFPGRVVHIAVWRVAMGRTPLLLLDTDLPENDPFDRPITAQLYMLGREMRFYQESVLGIGGTRVLQALGIQPGVYHKNEGHSALLLVERLAQLVKGGKSLAEAKSVVESQSVLTIHTPVPAGNERFDAKLVAEILGPTLEAAGLEAKQILKLGLDSVADKKVFDMTAFALRLSRAANGVSILHGHTADGTWRPVVHKPVGAVTNGVHVPTWLGPEMRNLYESAGMQVGTHEKPTIHSRKNLRGTWEGLVKLDGKQLWAAHVSQKRALAAFAADRLVQQHVKYGWSPEELAQVHSMFDPDAFVIGFARRFTPYKRPALLWSDIHRLAKLLGDPDRPVQLVFAGKAHPADGEGQQMVAEVYQLTQHKKWRGKVFFLEEYDMAVGRHLVQGVDLWINNPLRPLEASGTSGMKAAINGVPNASVLDGWWDEGFEGDNGWEVGSREQQKNRRRQDKFDCESLYETLEKRVLPMFWNRDSAGVPVEWTKVMKRAIATSAWAFSTRRMLEDYSQEMYAAK